MSNLFSIQAGLPRIGSGETLAPQKAATPSPAPSASPSSASATQASQVFVNPSFQFDPSVGLLVIEFHDDTGKLTSSIPSQRQLDAYRSHQETPPGQQPPQAVAHTPPPTADVKTPPG
jgi:hypothetical protein